MFKKIMAGLGVGSAKVDLVLDNEHCRIGEPITGNVIVEGGNVGQKINAVDFDLVMRFNVRGKEFTKVVDTIRVARDISVEAKESRAIPFEHHLPFHYPISKGSLVYYLKTKMDVARAKDAGDSDKLVVLPSRDMALVMEALETLGFKEKIGSGKIEKYGQEFDYYPTTLFAEQLRELEVKFAKNDNGIKVFLELNLAGGYLSRGAKHHAELSLSPDRLAAGSGEQLAGYIKEFIEKELSYVSERGPMAVPSYQNNHHYQQQHHGGAGFGGLMGGMVTGLLGAALFDNLFGGDENTDEGSEDNEADAGADGGDEAGGGLLDFDMGDLGDLGDFGDDF